MDRQKTAEPGAPDRASGSSAQRKRWLPVFSFRRSLVTSAVIHGTLLAALLALGLGPSAKEGRIWLSTALAVARPESSLLTPPEDAEPDLEPEQAELLEPEMMPIEPGEPPPEPLPELEPELADVLATDELWASFSLEPLRRIVRPEIEELSSEELAQADLPEPAASAAAEVEAEPSDPVILNGPLPVYPRISLRLGHEGVVLVRIHVYPSGRFARVELVESSGHERLDQSALETVRAWRFRPASERGVAVAGILLHRVVFRIDELAGR